MQAFSTENPTDEAQHWASLCLGHSIKIINEHFGDGAADKNVGECVRLTEAMLSFISEKRNAPDVIGAAVEIGHAIRERNN